MSQPRRNAIQPEHLLITHRSLQVKGASPDTDVVKWTFKDGTVIEVKQEEHSVSGAIHTRLPMASTDISSPSTTTSPTPSSPPSQSSPTAP